MAFHRYRRVANGRGCTRETRHSRTKCSGSVDLNFASILRKFQLAEDYANPVHSLNSVRFTTDDKIIRKVDDLRMVRPHVSQFFPVQDKSPEIDSRR
jgi:hypothetical protein